MEVGVGLGVEVGDVVTAAQADAVAGHVAGALHAAGVRRGDRVALVVPGSPALVAVALAALRAGVVPVVLDPGTPADELAEVLADADPALVVRDGDDLAGLVRAGEHPAVPSTASPLPLSPVPLARPMHYTSGTTGRRKGVWSGVLTQDDARRLWGEEIEQWGLGPADVHLVVSPLHHSAPLRFALATLHAGGSVVVPGRFTVDGFLQACRHHRPTTLFTAPAQLQRLHERAVTDPGPVREALRGFRLVAHAGAPCPDPVRRWLIDVVGTEPVWEFYGATEGQFTACPAAQWLERPGTVGRARAGRTLSVDADGTIWCAVPPWARFSYWGDPERTAQAWRHTPAGPAFTVGDHGRLDADGFLYLTGRREDLVITGGVNVYPLEVERVLSRCPGVREVVVVGVPDERWGQRLEAVVVPTDRSPATAGDVTAFAREHLPPARRPKDVHVLDEGDLPRTSSGKVRRLELADRLTGAAPPPR
ncbi:class I adenylate-forming enzyme family protein [Quadrisphaera sp. GCM10027208]|uniref:class I adenylate-forming enzyme family protein n=1 Tax=Quadrisphaera sp. GCM10027208 TaxID=3273423 RepID=UPI003612D7B5